MSVDYHAWTHRPRAQGGTDPIETSVLLPTVYCTGAAQTLDEGEEYILNALTGNGHPVSGTGIMSQIVVANDPGDGTGVFNVWDGENVQTVNGYYLMGFEAGVEFSDPWTGYAYIRMAVGSMFPIASVTGVSSLYNIVNETTDLYTLRIAGQMIVNAPNFADVNGNGANFMPVVVQETGSAQDIRKAWFVLSRLSVVEDVAFFTP